MAATIAAALTRDAKGVNMSGTEKRLRGLSMFLLVSGITLVAAALHSGYVLGVHFDETGTSGFLTSATIAALVLGTAQAVTGLVTLLRLPTAATTSA
ncbi:hypothetical protein ACFS27_23290 [Promicromonospora vindobonensis]|uniref:Uncharacterized protein n=1 Tax=Promicromonospora vindobonensis TaxID=195748 RepID=A0ABW5VZR4_9MICO